eukprot:208411_1
MNEALRSSNRWTCLRHYTVLTQELGYLNDALEFISFVNKNGHVIFEEGDDGDKFYAIKKGNIKWSKKNGKSPSDIRARNSSSENAHYIPKKRNCFARMAPSLSSRLGM